MKIRAVLLFLGVAASSFAQYRVVFLPTASGEGWALGAGGGQIVGAGFFQGGGPLLWEGPPYDKYVRLMPPGFDSAIVRGVGGGFQVGEAFKGGRQHALIWNGTASSFVDLDSANYAGTAAYATDGKSQVGAAGTDPNGSVGHAILWHGSAESLVDLNPSGYESSHAYGVWGNVQVGQLEGSYPCLWRGTPESMRLLTLPDPRSGGAARGIHGNQIAGGSIFGAMVWDANTLKPTFLGSGFALATNGVYQVGISRIYPLASGPFGDERATRWSGRPGTRLDLQQFVPLGFVEQSVAYGIDENGVIVGYVDSGPDVFPVAWVPVGGG
jgi:hypothetical protein